jgi:RNA polymerase sigma-70 factor (ECF subfamily)
MKHFLANEWHRARTRKRGGGVTTVELDALDPEARYALEPALSTDPDASFDREWAQQSVARAMEVLRAESEASGKGDLFEALKGSLMGEEPARSETAERLGMTEGAVKVAVHRLRKRYRELLRSGIAETVSDPSDVDDEMRYLVAAIRRMSMTKCVTLWPLSGKNRDFVCNRRPTFFQVNGEGRQASQP